MIPFLCCYGNLPGRSPTWFYPAQRWVLSANPVPMSDLLCDSSETPKTHQGWPICTEIVFVWTMTKMILFFAVKKQTNIYIFANCISAALMCFLQATQKRQT